MIFSEHFLGFDPTQGIEQFGICPRRDEGATIVWFEKWAHTGWTFGLVSDTGISYNRGYVVFDMLGNVIPNGFIQGFSGCGFIGNETCRFTAKCPTDDFWLAKARAACGGRGLPPPGAIQFVPGFGRYIGR